MDLDTVVRQNPETPTRRIEDFIHVLDATDGTLHTFNDVGGRIWELIDGERSVADIAVTIESEYDVDAAQAAADVVAFLDDLAAKGLVLVG
jgi:nucleoside-diphosphate-sugar epimerase